VKTPSIGSPTKHTNNLEGTNMLNWDDPLQPTTSQPVKPNPPAAMPPADEETPAPQPISAHNTQQHPHAGDGIVDNATLMATAGAAPAVNPDPSTAAAGLLADTGATGLEAIGDGGRPDSRRRQEDHQLPRRP
jgi:ribonucleoside-diphosphate reductase beta chain